MRNSIQLLVFLISFSALSQQKGETELRITLREGSSFSGRATMGNVMLITPYGKLDIPLASVTSVELGITPDKANETKIINLVRQLGNSDASMRKSAYEELTKSGIGAISVISSFIYSEKYTPAEYSDYTPENALSELKAMHNADESMSDKDVVTIDGMYNMGGVYDFKKIDLKTEYGTLSLPKEKIKRIDVLYTPSGDGSERSFVLLASKHISSNVNGGWLKTGVMLKQGQKFTIHSSGEITLASLSNNKYKPDGKTSGTSMDYDYGEEGTYAAGSAYPVYGNVVYKVGETGPLLKAGARFSGTVNASGMLYISIYETVYNAGNSGSYNVKISVK